MPAEEAIDAVLKSTSLILLQIRHTLLNPNVVPVLERAVGDGAIVGGPKRAADVRRELEGGDLVLKLRRDNVALAFRDGIGRRGAAVVDVVEELDAGDHISGALRSRHGSGEADCEDMVLELHGWFWFGST